jgi:asparagine N-glycosylation enzyme membrane subunit Stt3
MVGFLKVAFSFGLLAGIWFPELVVISAAGIAFFMFFAILMHIKLKDSIVKSIPAITFLILSILIVLLFE